jgi:hypothetical protein
MWDIWGVKIKIILGKLFLILSHVNANYTEIYFNYLLFWNKPLQILEVQNNDNNNF